MMVMRQRLLLLSLIQNPWSFMTCIGLTLKRSICREHHGARMFLMKSSPRIYSIIVSILKKCSYFCIIRRNIREAHESVIALSSISQVLNLKRTLSFKATGRILLLHNSEISRVFLVKQKGSVGSTIEVQISGGIMKDITE